MTENCNDSIEVSGPGGWGAKLGGKRMAELISILLGVVMLALGVMTYKMMEQVSAAITSLSQAQRELTCIISRPQEEREREYLNANSFCKQIGRLP